MKTFSPKVSEVTRRWYVVDAEGQTLGRLASNIAGVLMGKHKPVYSPHLDMGDYVIVVNAAKIHVTGNKMDEKFYTRHSQYPGGFRKTILRDQLVKHADEVIVDAVWNMLPNNRLRRRVIKKLKVYVRGDHPHLAHKPEPLEFKS